ncbi:MAG: hypothetical protein I8H75_05855 [Myxococcaceae bacterium]|nr:hypothetical protein [Myxococcaceae bacterium]
MNWDNSPLYFYRANPKPFLGCDQVFRILQHIAQEANKHSLDNPIQSIPTSFATPLVRSSEKRPIQIRKPS